MSGNRYGRPKRTKADKRGAAIQFVILSNRSTPDKIKALMSSYGMTEAEAHQLIKQFEA